MHIGVLTRAGARRGAVGPAPRDGGAPCVARRQRQARLEAHDASAARATRAPRLNAPLGIITSLLYQIQRHSLAPFLTLAA